MVDSEDIKIEKKKPKGMIAFRVYIPEEKKHIINKYISYAKLYENNQVWQVMEKAFRKMEEEENERNIFLEEMKDRLLNFEQRLSLVENALENSQEKEEESKKVSTFGGTK